MEKINIYSLYTDNVLDMVSIFRSSIDVFKDYFDINMIHYPYEYSEIFQDKNFKAIHLYKIDQIIETTKANFGKIIIWSDCDVLFLKNPYKETIEYARQYDLSFFDNGEYLTSRINMGFIVINCNEKTLSFWLKVRAALALTLKIMANSKTQYYSQDIIYAMLKELKNITYGVLPDSFWNCHRNNPIYPPDCPKCPPNPTIIHFTVIAKKYKRSIIRANSKKLDIMKKIMKEAYEGESLKSLLQQL